jgi:hypothetical protein
MTRKYPPRQCKNPKCRFGEGAPKIFVPERKWQRFCCTICRHQFHGPGMIYVPVALRQGGPSRASRDAVSARRPRIVYRALVWRTGAKFGFEKRTTKSRAVLRVDSLGVVRRFELLPKKRNPQITQISQIQEGVAA